MSETYPSHALREGGLDMLSVAFEALIARRVLEAPKERPNLVVGLKHVLTDHSNGGVVAKDEGEKLEGDSLFFFEGFWGDDRRKYYPITEVN